MQKQIFTRLAAFGRQTMVSAAMPRIAVAQPQIFRPVLAAQLHLTPARFSVSSAEYVEAQKARDEAALARRNAAKQEFDQLPEEERTRILEARTARRTAHIAEIEAIKSETYVTLDYAVEKYRRGAIAGPNYRGSAINWIIRNPWVLRLLKARAAGPDGKREVIKERVDAANFRILRFSRFPEVNCDEEWDGDITIDVDWTPRN